MAATGLSYPPHMPNLALEKVTYIERVGHKKASLTLCMAVANAEEPLSD